MRRHISTLFQPIATVALVLTLLSVPATPTNAAGTTYYVSTAGNDTNAGTTENAPLATIAKVNTLDLKPGDSVLFKCGDTWRAQMLKIEKSGSAGSPITYGSYPAGCANRPVLAGTQFINAWSRQSDNIFVADLQAAANAGKFPAGINQVFRGEQRLPFGRWPNLGELDNGYTAIDTHPSGTIIQDAQLPAGINWSGAVAHIKGMRWYILNRQVVSASSGALTLANSISCYEGCAGWGYWLSNHLATLDREGEWFYDPSNKRVYLYTSSAPTDGQIEGSVIMNLDQNGQPDTRTWGGIVLGKDLAQQAQFVTIENFELRGWYRNGIASPTNYSNFELNNVTIRNNSIRDVNNSGISLATWVFDPKDGRKAGWRGGYALEVSGNTIDGANRYGILLYSRDSRFIGNTLKNIALIGNVGQSGMGCSFSDGEGQCTQDGTGFMVYSGENADSGHSNLFQYNRLEKIGNNGWLIFGYGNTLRNNVIREACRSKGDCAGIRPFGDGNLAAGASNNTVRNITIDGNIVIDTLGNTDGAIAKYKELFGFGINADYTTNVTISNNVVISSTTYGLLYKKSTGSMSGNLLFNNARTSSRSQITAGEGSRVSMNSNLMVALNRDAQTVSIDALDQLVASDNNYFVNPFRSDHSIIAGTRRTLDQWRSATGKDAASKTVWFSQQAGETPLTEIFYNETQVTQTVSLGRRAFLNLDRQAISGTLTLAPFSAIVLVANGEISGPLPTATPTAGTTPGPTAPTTPVPTVGTTQRLHIPAIVR